MIPSGNTALNADLEVVVMPSKQHRMNLYGTRIVGICDTLEAIEQTVFKILSTERYKYIIYSWNYGIELADLFGQPTIYVCTEIERRVKEALLQDDRISDVDNFEFEFRRRGTVSTKFTVHTIFGDLDEELAVNI